MTIGYQTHPEFRPINLGLKLAVYTSRFRNIGEDGDEKRHDWVLKDHEPACLAMQVCQRCGWDVSAGFGTRTRNQTRPSRVPVSDFLSGTVMAEKKTSLWISLGDTNSHSRRKKEPSEMDWIKSNQGRR